MMTRGIVAVSTCALLLGGCSTESREVTAVPSSPASAAPEAPAPSPAIINDTAPTPTADASAFWFSGWSSTTGQNAGYFFESPSGRWRCAISEAFRDIVGVGCESAQGRVMNVPGAPPVPAADTSVRDPVPPSAIVMLPAQSAHFVKLGQPFLVRPEQPTPVLPYGRELTALGFTCNTQESGISCRYDQTGQAFTFSSKGYSFEYTPVAP